MKKTRFITNGAIIAAMYVVLTLVANSLNLASGAVQIRLSEALTVLPYFTMSSVSGLFVGCIISNLITGAVIWDTVFGSLATLIGALITRAVRKKSMYLAPAGPIVANTIVVPLVLAKAYHVDSALWLIALTVGIGEIISCGVLGIILLKTLKKHASTLFKD